MPKQYDEPLVRKNIHLTERQVATLEKISKSRLAPINALVRRAIDEWIERQPEQGERAGRWE